MQFNLALIVAALSASGAMAATVTGFADADCTGTSTQVFSVQAPSCFIFGNVSIKSIEYSGVPNSIQFFQSSDQFHNVCLHASQLTRGAGSGCANAPVGHDWEGVLID